MKICNMKKYVAIILAAMLMLTSSLALADTVITVTGSGETQVSADTAIVSLGVNARDRDVLAAQQKVNAAIDAGRPGKLYQHRLYEHLCHL